MTTPFKSFAASAGIAPNLIPTPPAAMPEAPDIPDAMAHLYPFKEAQDVDSIINNITIERPLPLYIPPELKHSQMEYHIINDTPQEYAAALRRHWKRVDQVEVLALFDDKVSGTDKEGKVTRPILMARDRRIGIQEAKLKAAKLAAHNAGLDPRNKQFNSKFADTKTVIAQGVTDGRFEGAGMGRIKQ